LAQFVKQGISAAAAEAADRKIQQTVESILADVAARGDAAVRELSEKFDKWSPSSFRLRHDDIAAIVSKVPQDTIADIRFAQSQVRNFAQAQRDALRDVEVETLPGVILGHKNIPVESVGCYVRAGAIPWSHRRT
jgi:sulfopropanediol 3-dehydrogenase